MVSVDGSLWLPWSPPAAATAVIGRRVLGKIAVVSVGDDSLSNIHPIFGGRLGESAVGITQQ